MSLVHLYGGQLMNPPTWIITLPRDGLPVLMQVSGGEGVHVCTLESGVYHKLSRIYTENWDIPPTP